LKRSSEEQIIGAPVIFYRIAIVIGRAVALRGSIAKQPFYARPLMATRYHQFGA
jgi:hypothetical protein